MNIDTNSRATVIAPTFTSGDFAAPGIYFSNGGIAGSVLPSSHSRNAPPAVDM
jgi:hypothetical protein